MPTLYLLTRPLNHFVSAEQGALAFTAKDFTGTNIIVDGKVLHLHDIRHFIETLIVEIKSLIREKLFFGLDVGDVEWSPTIVHEEPRNTSAGYSCFGDARNEFLGYHDELIRAVLTHPLLRGRFHFLGSDGRIIWKAGACYAYMDTCHEVEMLLFSGSQTSYGEPGRGTEIASHLIGNISGGSIRNIFVMFQHFCMMGTFNKTSHLQERDSTMIRVPHPEIGRLWMVLITYVRPLLAEWQMFFRGAQAASRARNHLFFGPHCPVTSGELSRKLSYHTYRLTGIKISIGLWRHIATWFLNYHAIHSSDQIITNRAALAAQMGHSEQTHGLYAGDNRLPGGIDFHVFFQTMRMSGVWHKILGFRTSNLLGDMNHNKHSFGPSCMVKRASNASPILEERQVATYATASDIADEVMKKIIPELVSIYSHTRANDLAVFLDAAGLTMPSPTSSHVPQPVTHLLHPSRLRDLRELLGDEEASFEDPQQALAVELIASGSPAILLVGPTRAYLPMGLTLNFCQYISSLLYRVKPCVTNLHECRFIRYQQNNCPCSAVLGYVRRL